jgi:hypothetical protein
MAIRTLAEFVTEPAKTAAPVAAAPSTPVAAAPAPAKVAAAPVAAAPTPVAAPVQKVATVTTTPAQDWAKTAGYGDVPAKAAEVLYAQELEAQKTAEEQQKQAMVNELEARGALQYHGMAKESCAGRLASKQASLADVMATCAMTGCTPADLHARALQIAKTAEVIGSQPDAGWVTSFWASGANPADSEVLAQAERNQNTTLFNANASQGTRQPVRGVDGKLLRFEEQVVMPGNPGMASGGVEQPVSNGKGLAG